MKPSARVVRWGAKPGARWCWSNACALRWANSTRPLPPEAIANAVDELTRDRSAMSLEAANREVYRLLKEGITVSVPEREHGGKSGGQCTERLRVVDWEHPENNDFLLVSQLTVTGPL
jgi:type I restriction enzyme R subunit